MLQIAQLFPISSYVFNCLCCRISFLKKKNASALIIILPCSHTVHCSGNVQV